MGGTGLPGWWLAPPVASPQSSDAGSIVGNTEHRRCHRFGESSSGAERRGYTSEKYPLVGENHLSIISSNTDSARKAIRGHLASLALLGCDGLMGLTDIWAYSPTGVNAVSGCVKSVLFDGIEGY